MDEFLEWLFGRGRQSVRRDVTLHLTQDEEGFPNFEPVEAEAFTLAPDGSMDRVVVTQDRFYHCGCSVDAQRVGGRCAEPGCGHVSCELHHSRCAVCMKPLCLECREVVHTTDGSQVALCAAHHAELMRGEFWNRLRRLFS